MSRLLPFLFIAWAAFTVFSIVDIVLIDRSRVRSLPKALWIVIVAIFPIVGGVMWFAVGRVRSRDTRPPVRRGPVAPDDDPEFLGRLGRERAVDDRIEQLEKELRDLDDDKPKD
jgi:hypothetical protein